MKRNKFLIIFLNIFICLLAVPSGLTEELAKGLPERLLTEKQEFYENQIPPEDKIFLDQLNTALLNLSKINEETLILFNASFPSGDKYYNKVIKSIKSAAKKANHKLTGVNKPFGILENFVRDYLPGNQQILQALYSLTTSYSTSEEIAKFIDSESKNMVYSEGAYHYYNLCAESFEKTSGFNLVLLLKGSADNYNRLGGLAKIHKIEELKAILNSSIGEIESALNLIPGRIINKIELTNRTWAREAITNTLNMLTNQLRLNNELNNALVKKFEEILLPREARLPDLTVSSIEIVLPPKIKKGTILKVIAEVKNEGNLSAERSRVLMVFPEGIKKTRPLPKLSPQESVKITWRYKVLRKGEHNFQATVNYDHRAWEVNTDNNSTRRTLIIPRSDPR